MFGWSTQQCVDNISGIILLLFLLIETCKWIRKIIRNRTITRMVRKLRYERAQIRREVFEAQKEMLEEAIRMDKLQRTASETRNKAQDKTRSKTSR